MSFRTILLTLITLIGVFTAHAVPANDCDYIKVKAYELQMDRQNGIKTDWQPSTFLERRMKNETFHHPQFRSITAKAKRAALFSLVWHDACQSGQYGSN